MLGLRLGLSAVTTVPTSEIGVGTDGGPTNLACFEGLVASVTSVTTVTNKKVSLSANPVFALPPGGGILSLLPHNGSLPFWPGTVVTVVPGLGIYLKMRQIAYRNAVPTPFSSGGDGGSSPSIPTSLHFHERRSQPGEFHWRPGGHASASGASRWDRPVSAWLISVEPEPRATAGASLWSLVADRCVTMSEPGTAVIVVVPLVGFTGASGGWGESGKAELTTVSGRRPSA